MYWVSLDYSRPNPSEFMMARLIRSAILSRFL